MNPSINGRQWSLTCFCGASQIWRGNGGSEQGKVEESDLGSTVWTRSKHSGVMITCRSAAPDFQLCSNRDDVGKLGSLSVSSLQNWRPVLKKWTRKSALSGYERFPTRWTSWLVPTKPKIPPLSPQRMLIGLSHSGWKWLSGVFHQSDCQNEKIRRSVS